MSVISGPNIPTDGLVLYYDMNNIQKSWRGAPTTNLISDPFATSGNPSPLFFSGYETINTRTTNLPDSRMRDVSDTWVVATKTTNTNGRVFFLNIGSLATNTDYCFSMYAFTDNTGTSQIACISDNGAVTPIKSSVSYNVNNRGTIQRINCVFTSTTGGQVIGVRVGATDPINSTFYFTGIQVEQGSFPTPIVNGTRSNTQALRDFFGNSTITLDSLTYTSSGSFTFNGTSNFLSISKPITSAFTEVTVELVFKSNDAGNSGNAYLIWDHSSGNPMWLGKSQGNQWYWFWNYNGGRGKSAQISSTSYQANTWIHIAVRAYLSNSIRISETNNFAELIVNGSNYSTVHRNDNDLALNYPSGVIYLARKGTAAGNGELGGTVSNFSNLEIPYVKIYNKVLSRNQIQQNFNAVRSKFGI